MNFQRGSDIKEVLSIGLAKRKQQIMPDFANDYYQGLFGQPDIIWTFNEDATEAIGRHPKYEPIEARSGTCSLDDPEYEDSQSAYKEPNEYWEAKFSNDKWEFIRKPFHKSKSLF